MDIHFISTLTPEDEDRYAPMVLAAVRAMLEPMPISYAVRIVTANGRTVSHTKSDTPVDSADEGLTPGRRSGPRLVPVAATRSSA